MDIWIFQRKATSLKLKYSESGSSMKMKSILGLLLISSLFSTCSKQIEVNKSASPVSQTTYDATGLWQAKSIDEVEDAAQKKQLAYGKELIAHTASYLGPKGKVMQISNGLNCQNCHLEAGTKPYGNNYGSVASMYPKLRNRSGQVENITKRINDCFERSLNGKALDSTSAELLAMKAYIEYIGSNVPKGESAKGSRLKKLAFLDRPADPVKGKEIYTTQCQSCHQADGQGVLNEEGREFTYPPLWGKLAYNSAAGLHRVSNFAAYVKANMPFGATYENPMLTDEEAWDVAAYVNSQFRPFIETPQDWPDLTKKPIDAAFGPYPDDFSVKQHKYGPFQAISDTRK